MILDRDDQPILIDSLGNLPRMPQNAKVYSFRLYNAIELAARLAGNLHAMEHLERATGLAVAESTMARALELAAALAGHALAAFGMMGADHDVEAAKRVLAWIRRDHIERFTMREAHRAVRGLLQKAEQVRAALSVLEERGHVRLHHQLSIGKRVHHKHVTRVQLHAKIEGGRSHPWLHGASSGCNQHSSADTCV
jgi:hypothetical protein